MKLIQRLMLVPAWLCLSAAALAQNAQAPTDQKETDEPQFGILLRPSVINGFLDQFVKRMERQYDLTPEQIAEIQQVYRERVPKFLLANQKEATALLNDFLDAINKDEPPTPERVAEWSKRALPMLEKARAFMGETSEAMKDHMSDEQTVKLDATMAALDVGVMITNKRLNDWAAGNYDPETEWHRNPKARENDRARERAARDAMEEARQAKLREYGMESASGRGAPPAPAGGAAGPAPRDAQPSPPAKAKPKDEWARYVDAQIARYDMDSEQQQKAQAFLNDAYQQREKYLASKASVMEQIEKRFKESKDKDELAAAEEKYQELLKPTERTFERLKEKLDTLPRRDQRAKAAAKDEKIDKTPVVEDGGPRAQKP